MFSHHTTATDLANTRPLSEHILPSRACAKDRAYGGESGTKTLDVETIAVVVRFKSGIVCHGNLFFLLGGPVSVVPGSMK